MTDNEHSLCNPCVIPEETYTSLQLVWYVLSWLELIPAVLFEKNAASNHFFVPLLSDKLFRALPVRASLHKYSILHNAILSASWVSSIYWLYSRKSYVDVWTVLWYNTIIQHNHTHVQYGIKSKMCKQNL